MRLTWLLLFFALTACDRPERFGPLGDAARIDPTVPPDGARMAWILLENQSLPVKGTDCEKTPAGFEQERTLRHKLAMLLGGAAAPGGKGFKLSGGCTPERDEKKDGVPVEYWLCSLGAANVKPGGERIFFGVTKDTWEFIPEKVMCR